jgi:hypothetical protein
MAKFELKLNSFHSDNIKKYTSLAAIKITDQTNFKKQRVLDDPANSQQRSRQPTLSLVRPHSSTLFL